MNRALVISSCITKDGGKTLIKMPHFRLETNISGSKVTPDFLKKTSAIVANTLGKPESYVVVTVIPDQKMAWGGTTDPCATATLMSIGMLGVNENKSHAAVIYDHIEHSLGIPRNRMYITFQDEKPSNVGHNGTTFHEIFGGK